MDSTFENDREHMCKLNFLSIFHKEKGQICKKGRAAQHERTPWPIITVPAHNVLSVYQYVLHKAVAEVSKIASYRRLVAVNHGSQSKSTDGSKSGWRQRSRAV